MTASPLAAAYRGQTMSLVAQRRPPRVGLVAIDGRPIGLELTTALVISFFLSRRIVGLVHERVGIVALRAIAKSSFLILVIDH